MKAKTSRSKRIASVVAAIAVLMGLLGGTYALFMDYAQHASNAVSGGDSIYHWVHLIEEFEENDHLQPGDEVKKEIRVKNMGGSAQFQGDAYGAVYVRLQLKEFMKIASVTYNYSAQRYLIDRDGNFVRFVNAQGVQDFLANSGNHAYDAIVDAADIAGFANILATLTVDDWVWEPSNIGDGTGYFYLPTLAHYPNGQYGKFLPISAEEGSGTSLIPLVSEETSVDYDTDNGHNGECAYTVHTWTERDGAGRNVGANGTAAAFRQYIEWVLGPDVTTYDQWVAGGMVLEKKWVLDTREGATQGWVYWLEPLQPGDTVDSLTSNLLEKFELVQSPAGKFYYTIHTDLQAVDYDGLTKWEEAPGGNQAPEDVLAAFRNAAGTVLNVRITPNTASVTQGETQQFASQVNGNGNIARGVNWSISAPGLSASQLAATGTRISDDGLLTVGATLPAGTVVTVTGTSTHDPSKTGTATATVTASAPVIPTVNITATGNVTTGTPKAISATIDGNTANAANATWTVDAAAAAAGVTVSSSGVLDVPIGTSISSVTVTVASRTTPPGSASKVFTVTPAPPIVVNITATGSVIKGDPKTISATVGGVAASSSNANWDIDAAAKTAGATISINGVLSVPTTASISTVTVTVSSKALPVGTASRVYTVANPDLTLPLVGSGPYEPEVNPTALPDPIDDSLAANIQYGFLLGPADRFGYIDLDKVLSNASDVQNATLSSAYGASIRIGTNPRTGKRAVVYDYVPANLTSNTQKVTVLVTFTNAGKSSDVTLTLRYDGSMVS